MKKSPRILIVFVVLFLFTALTLTAKPGNDPNAAVRYLLAIGQLPFASEKVLDELGLIEKFEDLQKIGKEGKAFLADEKIKMSMRMLQLGAACPTCNFTPDDKQTYEDAVSPYRRLRQLARLARVYAWDREKAGDLAGAVESLTAAFMLGQHLEEGGILISTMVGVACRKLAVVALLEFRTRHQETMWKDKLVAFFKKIPHPSADILASLKYERVGVENTLRAAKASPEMFRTIGIPVLVPAVPAAAAESAPTSASLGKECLVGQRILAGAIEMLAMDYSFPFPATITADLPNALVSLKYLKMPAVCPAGGKINVTLDDKGKPTIECVKHGTVDSPSPEAQQAKADMNEVVFQYYSKLVGTPEYDRLVTECFKFYDELMALELSTPTAQSAYDSLWEKINASKNPFAQRVIPNFRKAWEEARKLEVLIEQAQK